MVHIPTDWQVQYPRQSYVVALHVYYTAYVSYYMIWKCIQPMSAERHLQLIWFVAPCNLSMCALTSWNLAALTKLLLYCTMILSCLLKIENFLFIMSCQGAA